YWAARRWRVTCERTAAAASALPPARSSRDAFSRPFSRLRVRRTLRTARWRATRAAGDARARGGRGPAPQSRFARDLPRKGAPRARLRDGYGGARAARRRARRRRARVRREPA